MAKQAGAVIRSLRRQRGVKPGAFAKQVGVSRGHMWAVEVNKVDASIELLGRIAERLGADLDDLLADRVAS